MLVRIVVILLLVLANAFFVLAEFAILRARLPRLDAMARRGDRLARAAFRAASTPAGTLALCALGTSLTSIGIGWVLAGWLYTVIRPAGSSAGIATIIVAAVLAVYLHILVGKLIPRTAALARPEHYARLVAYPLLGFSWILTPLTALVAVPFRRASREIRERVPAGEAGAIHGPDELRLLVEQSEEVGALEPQDADLLEGVFEFTEKTADDVMTPRTELVALPVDATLDQTLEMLEESGFSRVPVYDGTIDNIVGLLLVKDLLPTLRRSGESFSLRDIIRSVHMIPATRQVEEVLADFKRLKEHMAIVLDEYGGTAGVVTMEDLLEEIVGEIEDEYDVADLAASAQQGGEIVVPGETNIGDLNEEYGLSVPDAEHSTIGGYVFGALGRLPHPGDVVVAGGASFVVLSMDNRRIESLAVRPRGD
ncbi:MAG TPA: hemolysin family protein [Gemmatimonadaceae bacterium]|nr:hemolysin family protein [Gemmatimonadaceae bacterium]